MDIIGYILKYGVSATFFLVCIVLLLLGTTTKKVSRKKILFNLSAVFLSFFLYEVYIEITEKKTYNDFAIFSGSFANNELVSGKKDIVGYGPRTDTSFEVVSIRTNKEKLIYKAIYSFKNGNRLVINNNDTSKHKLLILGGSHAFGDGLNDNQTLPYYINKHSNQRFNITNRAFSGYGTHQALKIIETMFDQGMSSSSDTVSVIYSYIPSHVGRAAGYKIWNLHGPKYDYVDGKLSSTGSFEDSRIIKTNFFIKSIRRVWRNSHLYKRIFRPEIKKQDILLVSEIIKKMNQILKHNNIRFIMIISGSDDMSSHEYILHDELTYNKVEHYFIDSIINDFDTQREKYIITGDGHPNDLYNSILGDFLQRKL